MTPAAVAGEPNDVYKELVNPVREIYILVSDSLCIFLTHERKRWMLVVLSCGNC